MAANTFTIFLKFRNARARAITQEGLAAIRRAPKNDRPGMCDRLVQRVLRECVTTSLTHPGGCVDGGTFRVPRER